MGGFVRRTLAFIVCAALGAVRPAIAAEDNWKARIDTLERELEEERARAAREREESDKRLRALEEQLRTLQEKSIAEAPAPTATPAPVAMPRIPGILNPAISVIGNFVFRGSDTKIFNDEGDRIDNRPHLREMELDARAAIDPYADGVFIAALESESPGEFEVGVEEGYATLRRLPFLDDPPLGAQLKLGRFRPAFGRINILHTHDLPQTERPLVIREFLGDEGFVGDGVSTQLSFPTPWDDESALDLLLQATTGDVAIASGGRNDTGFLGHLRWFRQMTNASSLEAGGSSYYARTETPLRESWMHGADVLYRWKPLRGGEFHSFLLGGEFLYADREFDERIEPEDEAAEPATLLRRTHPLGVYGFAQYQPAKRWYLGVRGDWTETIDDDDATRRGVTPYVSYYFSEFLRFRLNYEHIWSDLADEDARNAVFLEANFIFGSHPPEPFWVNK